MTEKEVIEIFKKTETIKKGHFRLASGLHSGIYLQKCQILQYPEWTEKLGAELASRFKDDRVELVIGPAVGGIILTYETARALGARNIFAEKIEGKRGLRWGFDIKPGERTLVVDDIATTGTSVKDVIELVKDKGGYLVGVGLLADRSGGKLDFGVRVEALATLDIKTYSPNDCPLCKRGIPLLET